MRESALVSAAARASNGDGGGFGKGEGDGGGSEIEPLVVIGPRPLKRILDMYFRIERAPIHFVDCATATAASQGEGPREGFEAGGEGGEGGGGVENGRVNGLGSGAREGRGVGAAALARALSTLRLRSLRSVEVTHSCSHAYGAIIEGEAGWKLAYSGDTRPCPALVRASRGATVLIHEATFESAMVDEAEMKRHSTTREAVDAGRECGAFRTVLTHFSQRYGEQPRRARTHACSHPHKHVCTLSFP